MTKQVIMALGLILAVVLIGVFLVGGGGGIEAEVSRARQEQVGVHYVAVYHYEGHTYLVFSGVNRSYPPFVIEVK